MTDYGISYLTLASDWAWYLFDRAVEPTCAATIASPWPIRDSWSRPARRSRPGPRPWASPGRNGDSIADRTSLPGILGQFDALQDQERRAREPRRRGPAAGAARPAHRRPHPRPRSDRGAPDQRARTGSTCGTRPVRAMIAEGEDAVEPLLEVLESDDRLTRSVLFGWGVQRSRLIHGWARPPTWRSRGSSGPMSFDGKPVLQPGLRRPRRSQETGRGDPRLLAEEQGDLAGRAVVSHAARRRGDARAMAGSGLQPRGPANARDPGLAPAIHVPDLPPPGPRPPSP